MVINVTESIMVLIFMGMGGFIGFILGFTIATWKKK